MLRYAPPIYMVIRIEIKFVIFILVYFLLLFFFSSVISNVSYSSLRFAPSTV